MLIQKFKTFLKFAKKGKWLDILRKSARVLLILFQPVFSPELFESIAFYLTLGYWPDLHNPRSFCEKLVYRKLYKDDPLYRVVSDKWGVREYVAERATKDILNEVYFVGDDPDKISFDDLPSKFAIKLNHGSKWNIFCTDKAAFDRQKAINQCKEWLATKYSETSQKYEKHYDTIKPLVVVEKFLEELPDNLPLDYKFMCFHGVVQFVYVAIYAPSGYTLNYYDTNWNSMDFSFVHPIGEPIRKPPQLDEMIKMAEKLSADFDYCRVDFYCPDDENIVFGEITICPGGGYLEFTPLEWDFKMGEYWKLDLTKSHKPT